MTVTLDDLVTPVTRDEATETMLSIAAGLDAPTTSWQEGDPTLTQIMTTAQKVADLSRVAVEITKGGFGDLLPSDAWADIWALSRFKVTRVPATQASGDTFTLTCLSTLIGNTYQPGEIIVAHATTGKLYRNSAIIALTPSLVLEDQTFKADEVGADSNAAPGTITALVSSIVGLSITNVESVIGTDKETTEHLVTRARSSLGAFSPNGPKDAYNYVATTPLLPDGTALSNTSTPITRTRTVVDEATGELAVYCATAAGAPSGGDVTIVQGAINSHAEPWGTTATAIAATEVVQDITYEAWVRGSQLTPAQLQSLIGVALVFYFSLLDIGGDVVPPDDGRLYVEAIEQVIGHASNGIVRVVVSLPASAVTLAANEVAVLGTITPTVNIL